MKYQHGNRRKAIEYEKALIDYWKKHNTFQKSIDQNPQDKSYVFYDGPPFITGNPHHGTLLSSVVKDAVPRFWTMNGFRVERRWGWDCHGLPAENFTEKHLGGTVARTEDPKMLELKIGEETSQISLEKYIETARDLMVANSQTWESTIDRIGRWVDFGGAYKTMDKDFMESVWWAFKELYEKGKIYEGEKVLMYDTTFATPVSKNEVTMDNDAYQTVTDPSVYVKFRLTPDSINKLTQHIDSQAPNYQGERLPLKADIYILAWTTTPWTLPGNTALAVNSDLQYVLVEKDEEILVLAKDLAGVVTPDYKVLNEISGTDLVGLSYEPIFTPVQGAHKIHAAPYVTTDSGTGIVHLAPIYGEEDFELAEKENIPKLHVLDDHGYYYPEVAAELHKIGVRDTDEKGIEVWAANKFIAKCLEEQGTVWKIDYIRHEYPFNTRSKQRIMYRAIPSWFLSIDKPLMLEQNQNINWFPPHLKNGRFAKNIEQAPDWNLSRDRFWATPMPVWKGDQGTIKVIGSYQELEQLSGKKLEDYHRPWIDDIEFDLPYKKAVQKQHIKLDKNSKVLFVCWANISRSQTAKAIYNKLLGDDIAESAGIGVEKEQPEGTTIAERNKIVGKELGIENYKSKAQILLLEKHDIDITDWSRTQFTPKMLEEYDLIVNIAEKFQTPDWFRGENVIWWDIKDPGILKTSEAKEAAMKVAMIDIEKRVKDLLSGKIIDDDIDTANSDKTEHFTRIEKVLDCWFESGSMPFAQLHYPFENKEKFEKNYPADFIVEYIGQVRAWFYYVHTVNTALFGTEAFRNVITTGTLAGNDGRKMSKSLGNYTDPNELMDKYSADALRFLMLSSPVLSGEDFALLDKDVSDVARKLAMIWNMYDFFTMYAEVDGWEWNGELKAPTELENPLDAWAISRIYQLRNEITANMEKYNLPDALVGVLPFIDDLSNWFVRRSRRRFWKSDTGADKAEAYETLHFVLSYLALLLAPFVPFLAEELWQNMVGGDKSVHLHDWPAAGTINYDVLDCMSITRNFIERGLALRMEKDEHGQIKIRQPLSSFEYVLGGRLPKTYEQIISEEINVKKVVYKASGDGVDLLERLHYEQSLSVRPSWGGVQNIIIKLDKRLTSELREEGFARELIRNVQSARKKAGLQIDDRINLSIIGLPADFSKNFLDLIKGETLAVSFSTDTNYSYDEIVKIDGKDFTISLQKA